MKKGVLLALLILAAITVNAVTYGERIPRIQELPSERAEREAEALPPPLTAGDDIKDVQKNLQIINDQVAALRTTVQNVRTEQSIQLSNAQSELSAVRSDTEELNALRTKLDEIPPLLEKPQPAPLFLTLLTIVNFLVLCGLAGMLWHLHGEHKTASHAHESHSHKELNEYIRKNLRAGMHIRDIKHYLLQHGWDEDEVDKAVHQIREGEAG
ncbi:MAG: hypothetical protein HY363_00110 [Candidatus Aenigmarchaeota archaeon]|nr:hypothetical protein [Candidatus Aenigmarchaeota archaeon]